MKQSPHSRGSSRGEKGKKLMTAIALSAVFFGSPDVMGQERNKYIPTTKTTLKTLCENYNSISFENIPIFLQGEHIPSDIPCYVVMDKQKNPTYYRYNQEFFTHRTRRETTTPNRSPLGGSEPIGKSTPITTTEPSAPKKEVENQQETFCGVSIDQLTDGQKELYNRLSPKERKELSSRVTISMGQIEFHKIKLAIRIADIIIDVTKSQADDIVEKMKGGWRLPRDIEFTEENEQKFDPVNSEYNAMMAQMPGIEKYEYFELLTGLVGRYRTAQKTNSSSKSIVLAFVENGWSRGSGDGSCNVRPVRDLP